jgi:hypothetical protein
MPPRNLLKESDATSRRFVCVLALLSIAVVKVLARCDMARIPPATNAAAPRRIDNAVRWLHGKLTPTGRVISKQT